MKRSAKNPNDDYLPYLTGAAHMLSIAAFGGTQNVSGLRLIRDLENIGAVISSSSDRERVSQSGTQLMRRISSYPYLSMEEARPQLTPSTIMLLIMDFTRTRICIDSEMHQMRKLTAQAVRSASYLRFSW